MFGKNYDDEIKYLREYTELLAKNIETLTELLEIILDKRDSQQKLK